MNEIIDLQSLYRRLAEAVAWCRRRADLSDPAGSLRTPQLWPANLHTMPNQWGNFDYEWETPEQVHATLATLATCRAERLQADGVGITVGAPDLHGGRLLVAAPEQSDWCCLSEYDSQGFIDALDVPPWDTWIGYLTEATMPDPEEVQRKRQAYRARYNRPQRENFVDWQPPSSVSYLLCWVPPEFLSLTEAGITVNPVECFFWASDYRRHHYHTQTLHQLEADGLLK